MKGEYIPVKETSHPDKDMAEMVNSYKKLLDERMGEVIGHSTQLMDIGIPESLLTNFTSDVMYQLDGSYTNGKHIDFSIMNVHGHRAPLPEGDITLGDIFSTYSFENELVLVYLRGNYLTDIFNAYARRGGAGISGNVKLTIKDKKLADAKIDGKPIDNNKIYTIVTLDYLAEGNDAMDALKNAESSTPIGLTLRDYILNYIRKETREGRDISSKLDGRITIR
ncbi:5'-nucleotidase C-terminal domain-containing protein [Dysgonomonas sp. 521]|uniref:5'-nucleotidase C-terminal domain-containing protein n=1 Tax=Dysgonomonas sp. 521 TaxID=2302932 RepID=UPI001C88992B|nr:5'-nucleotidase C-terminal domain-containing protein [Dysgonomonas sp. 521]